MKRLGQSDEVNTNMDKPVQAKGEGIPKAFSFLALGVLLFTVFVVWSIPRPIGDLFVALAGGRDVVDGSLGKPDTWSFMTHGRVWLNQNWGTGLIFYSVFKLMGGTGLLILKYILILFAAVFSALAAREKKAASAVSLTVAAIILLSSQSFIDLRPNLMSIVFAPLVLWLLYLSRRKPLIIWAAAAGVTIWANVHGGFIFGLGIMFLWAISSLLSFWRSERQTRGKYNFNYIAATLVTTMLVWITSPFGIKNLLEPFTVFKSSKWLEVSEWRPIYLNGFGSVWQFITIVIITGILLSVMFFTRDAVSKTTRKSKDKERSDVWMTVFECILVLVVILMAVKSRRFIPLALVLMTPSISMIIDTLIKRFRVKIIIPVITMLALVFSITALPSNLKYYDDKYPYNNPGSFYEKMNFVSSSYPVNLVEFANKNKIGGNVLAPWTWEGFLHWNSPQLKVFTGGRAQQIYDDKTLDVFYGMLACENLNERLKKNNVQLIAVPCSNDYDNLIMETAFKGTWVIIYSDGKDLMLADSSLDVNKEIIEKARSGSFTYNNEREKLICWSNSNLFTEDADSKNRVFQALTESVRDIPSTWVYNIVGQRFLGDKNKENDVLLFLNDELSKLEKMDVENPRGSEIILSRLGISAQLLRFMEANKIEDKNDNLKNYYLKNEELYQNMSKKWRE